MELIILRKINYFSRDNNRDCTKVHHQKHNGVYENFSQESSS